MNNGVVVVVSNIIEKLPTREDYFGETKYYSPRFAALGNHSHPKIGEGKYYSPGNATSKNYCPPEKSEVPPKNRTKNREDFHVREATGPASHSSPEICNEKEEYYESPPNESIDALILFTSSYLEDNRKRYDQERYLVCKNCGGYYHLQDDEEPEDFSDECECGGRLKYKYGD